MGILYNAASPSALVNNQLVELNKPARMQTGQGEVEVKAVTITRDLVVLEVGGQKMELRLGGTDRDKGSK
jgi:ribosomal protein L16/L10AE